MAEADLRNLHDPMVVIAFSGWSDAAQAASDAADHLVSHYSGEVVATVDPDDYYDFQTSRPLVSLDEDGDRVISWPTTEVLLCHLPMRDVVVIRGPEPNFRWPSFAAALSTIVAVVDPELVVVLGALLSENPHSRPVPVSLSSSDVTLRERFGAERSTYEGPTGMQGVMAQACQLAGIPTVSVWAACPHYVASPPNPKATLALLSHLEDLLGGPIDQGDLAARAEMWERSVDDLASDDPDVAEYIANLESASDAHEPEVSGDAIAAEFQRYLRRRDQ
jgi:hypothetical protein